MVQQCRTTQSSCCEPGTRYNLVRHTHLSNSVELQRRQPTSQMRCEWVPLHGLQPALACKHRYPINDYVLVTHSKTFCTRCSNHDVALRELTCAAVTVVGLRALGHTLAAEKGLPRRVVTPAAGLARIVTDCMFACL